MENKITYKNIYTHGTVEPMISVLLDGRQVGTIYQHTEGTYFWQYFPLGHLQGGEKFATLSNIVDDIERSLGKVKIMATEITPPAFTAEQRDMLQGMIDLAVEKAINELDWNSDIEDAVQTVASDARSAVRSCESSIEDLERRLDDVETNWT